MAREREVDKLHDLSIMGPLPRTVRSFSVARRWFEQGRTDMIQLIAVALTLVAVRADFHPACHRPAAGLRVLGRSQMAARIRSQRARFTVFACVVLAGSLAMAARAAIGAAETPRRGGVLLAAIAADAPSLDIHQESTF